MSDRIVATEDGQPIIEESIKGMLGKEYKACGRFTRNLSRAGELTPDNMDKA